MSFKDSLHYTVTVCHKTTKRTVTNKQANREERLDCFNLHRGRGSQTLSSRPVRAEQLVAPTNLKTQYNRGRGEKKVYA